jgi:hypothetical protein
MPIVQRQMIADSDAIQGQAALQSGTTAPGIVQRDESYRTFEFYNLSGVLEAKAQMQRRLDNMFEYATIAVRVGDALKSKLLNYSEKYSRAYADYASAIRKGRQEAQDENMYLGICLAVALNVTAAFILPATAAGWFVLTAAEAATALASGAAQVGAGIALGSLLQVSGGDLEPGGLSPAAQELPAWRKAAALYRAAAQQVKTIRNLASIVSGADFLIGEIRVQVSRGLPTMTEDQALARVDALGLADRKMAEADDSALAQSLNDLRAFEARVNGINPGKYPQRRIEQDIWILWMAGLWDASVLDRDAIEDRLHEIGVLGENSRLGVDFGSYTFWYEEDKARDAAMIEADNIRRQMEADMSL